MHFNSGKCNSYKFSLALPEVSSEVMRFIKPSSSCLIFESERKILVLTKLLHVRIGRLNLHSFCPEIIMVVSDFLQLHLLFPLARGCFSHQTFYNFIILIESNLLLASIQHIYGITQMQVKASSIFCRVFSTPARFLQLARAKREIIVNRF